MSAAVRRVPADKRRGSDGELHGARFILAVPALLAMLLLFVGPLLLLLRLSFDQFRDGVIASAWSLESYAKFFSDPFYLAMLWRTVRLGLSVTLLTLLLGYPVALFLARTKSRWRMVLAVLVVAPLLTSVVVRTYGWMVILGNSGLVNTLLLRLHLVDAPVKLLHSELGVMIGLVQVLLPYMVLATMSGLSRLSDTLEDAAANLGSGPVRTFFRVTLPLSLPGILTGCLLVFVQTISSFVTPTLLGGNRVLLMATEIYDQAVSNLNWPFSGAMAFVLLVLFALVIWLYSRVQRRALNW